MLCSYGLGFWILNENVVDIKVKINVNFKRAFDLPNDHWQ